MNNSRLKRMFRPAAVAIVGATDTPGKVGTVITENLLDGGFIGNVICVNPNRSEVFGRRTYPSLSAAGERVDVAIIVVPAASVVEVIEESVDFCRNFVVIAGGFAESGSEGIERQERLRSLVEREKLIVLGPNCLGFINPALKLNASFAGGMPVDGRVALLSQSGALITAILDKFAFNSKLSSRELRGHRGFSLVASLGNKMSLTENELLPFLAEDEQTGAIGIYAEQITEPEKFFDLAAGITARKPIVLLKGARSSAGSRAGASHTGALTQPDEVIEAAARKSGIWRARDIDEFITLLDLAEVYGPLKPSQAVIVTNAGGVGVLTADACQAAGVELFAPDRLLREELARKLPAAASVANPIDLLGDASETRYDDALTSLAEEETTKTALVLLTPQENTPVSKVAQAVLSHAKCDDMPIIASFVGGMRVREAISYLQRGGAVHSGSPERAARVLGIVNRAQPYGSRASEFTPERKRADAGEVLAARLRDERRGGLYYSEARELTGLYGLPTAKAWRLDYNSPAEISYPCVVKVDSPSLAHKTDRGGVISGIENEEALVAAAEKLGRLFPGERIIAQEMLPTGEEIILGAARKDGFGPVVLVGYGGIYAEQIGLTEILIPPFSSEEAAEILRASSLGFLFAGARSQAPYNVGELASLAKALGEMLLENPWIKEADLNPLFIYNDQKPAVAVDVKIFSMREEENSFKG